MLRAGCVCQPYAALPSNKMLSSQSVGRLSSGNCEEQRCWCWATSAVRGRKREEAKGPGMQGWAGPGPSPLGLWLRSSSGEQRAALRWQPPCQKTPQRDFLPLWLQSFCRCVLQPGRTKARGCELAPARVSPVPSRLWGNAGGRKPDRAVPGFCHGATARREGGGDKQDF